MRKYYNDAYKTTFTAKIINRINVDGQTAVQLDETYFYPTGGGQPYDIGTLNGVNVHYVITQDDRVLHVLEAPLDDETVTGEIDWTRRFDHMQQHTGQHILSRAFEIVADAETIGFHLSDNSLTIDLDRDVSDIDAAEDLANRIVMDNRPVRGWFPNEAELAQLELRKISDKVTGDVRVVAIEGFDACACGGTHVSRTGEIGQIKITRVEKRKQGLRIEFACGWRALRDYRAKNMLLTDVSNALTVGYWEIPEALERFREENKALAKRMKEFETRLYAYEAEAFWAAAAGQSPVVVREVLEDHAPSAAQSMASALIAKPDTIVLFALMGERTHLVFGASEEYDVVPALKDALAKLNGKGGGRPNLAQGSADPAERKQLEGILQAAAAHILGQ